MTSNSILITGFDPFGNDTLNASWEAVKALPEEICGYAIRKLMIPTTFCGGAKAVLEEAKNTDPAFVIMTGQADGRAGVTPELKAVNRRNARIPDNDGYMPLDLPVIEGVPSEYHTAFPVQALVSRLKDAGLAIDLSDNAGLYVCNSTYFEVGTKLASQGINCLFVHLPAIPEQAKDPGVSMKTEEAAVILTKLIGELVNRCEF